MVAQVWAFFSSSEASSAEHSTTFSHHYVRRSYMRPFNTYTPIRWSLR